MRFQVMRLAITLQFSKMTKNGAKRHILMKKNHLSFQKHQRGLIFGKIVGHQ